jgi:hypothetical protein
MARRDGKRNDPVVGFLLQYRKSETAITYRRKATNKKKLQDKAPLDKTTRCTSKNLLAKACLPLDEKEAKAGTSAQPCVKIRADNCSIL